MPGMNLGVVCIFIAPASDSSLQRRFQKGLDAIKPLIILPHLRFNYCFYTRGANTPGASNQGSHAAPPPASLPSPEPPREQLPAPRALLLPKNSPPPQASPIKAPPGGADALHGGIWDLGSVQREHPGVLGAPNPCPHGGCWSHLWLGITGNPRLLGRKIPALNWRRRNGCWIFGKKHERKKKNQPLELFGSSQQAQRGFTQRESQEMENESKLGAGEYWESCSIQNKLLQGTCSAS